jgi:5-methylcytosine-specific restriction endonuclease McrA
MRTDHRLSARQRGYTWQWEKARADFLADPDNQFCVKCKARGLLNAGTMRMDGTRETSSRRIGLVVNHRVPHRGDQRLFWDRSNWEPLCHDDHDITAQREEHGRVTNGADVRGRPLAADHPWNRGDNR